VQADQRPVINLSPRIRIGLKPDQPQEAARPGAHRRREGGSAFRLGAVDGQRLPLLAGGPLHDEALAPGPVFNHG
jgi:hypothetical protein